MSSTLYLILPHKRFLLPKAQLYLQGVRILGQARPVIGVRGQASQIRHALRDVEERLVLQADHAAGVGALGIRRIAARDAEQDADAVEVLGKFKF